MSNAEIRGRFIWHELMTTDPDAAGAFYSKVVPWKTQPSGMPSYTLWMAGKTQIGGLMALPDSAEVGTPPHWIVYIATPDVDATVAQAERLGGKVLKSASDIPNIGRFAVLTDPQGAAFAVYTPSPSGAAQEANGSSSPGEFTWHELATTDHAAALSFYTELFGWEKGPAHDMGAMGVYQLINRDGANVGGLYKVQSPSTPPHWLSYVQVPDCAKATAAAKAAGGRVVHGPVEVPGGSWITMMMDPQGGAFAVVEPPKVAAEVRKPAARANGAKPASSRKPKAVAGKAEAAKPAAAQPKPAASTPSPVRTAAKKAGKKAAKKAAKTGGRKPATARRAPARSRSTGARTAAKKAVGRKTAGKKAAAKKGPAAKRASAKSAKRGRSVAKKGSAAGKRAAGKSAKRR
jgi:predicted enzyme related to lactoylglutathione lyase